MRKNFVGKITIIVAVTLLVTTFICGGSSGDGSSASTISSSQDRRGSEQGMVSRSGGNVTISWVKPTTNGDGSQLTELAGYKVYYGTSSRGYVYSLDVGNSNAASINNLSSERWCFAITAYDYEGNESNYSEEACVR